MSRPILEDEVFVRAYCAALTGFIGRSGNHPGSLDADRVKPLCVAAAEDAVAAWRSRSTRPGGNGHGSR